MRIEANDREAALQELQHLRDIGVLDENDQIIKVPDDVAELMKQLG